jgi:BirA family biotin operon repressor/biotin-[acetyl-CoA-carboxylase] ligase
MEFFRILDRVDSTNNYAMAAIHEGMAKHGMAWFAREQQAGKGQRGKQWHSLPGQNITMSIVLEPPVLFHSRSFLFNAMVAVACHDFFSRYINQDLKIKWPNDLYVRDRKAGGILIENIYQGKTWKWAVVGTGININQLEFPELQNRATSIGKETGIFYDVTVVAENLYEKILEDCTEASTGFRGKIMEAYNQHLFRAGEKVKLRKQNMVFETTILGVNDTGQLLTTDTIERSFEFGEVEWVL